MRNEISVIIPVYNKEKYLERCIESVLNQTYENLEIILINDGSSDGSLQICEKYNSMYSNIRLINKENGGVSSARNMGLDHVSGECICFVDADDCIHPKYIEHLYRMIEEYHADISLTGYIKFEKSIPDVTYIDEKCTIIDKWQALEKVSKDYLWLVPWGKMYKKSVFDGIRYPLNVNHEDEYIIHKIYDNTSSIVYDLQPLYYYYECEDSIMNKTYSVSRMAALDAIEKRLEFYEERKQEKLCQLTILELMSMYRRHYYLVKKYLKKKDLLILLKKKNNDLFINNKKRCHISYLAFPELYILRYPLLKPVSFFLYKVKHKLGRECW